MPRARILRRPRAAPREPGLDDVLSRPVAAWVRHALPGPRWVSTPPQTAMARARGRAVHQLADHHGDRWYLKIEPRPAAWAREVAAYGRWDHVDAGSMPRLAAADEALQVVLLSALPGHVCDGSDLDHFRRAGAWLARFHTREEPRPRTASFAQAGQVLDAMRQRDPEAVDDAAYDFARSAVRMLEQRPSLEPLDMPSHGDFRPHNWLTDGAGPLGVIDFGESGWHPPTRDLAGLSYAWWQRTPGAEQAFTAGYGRRLTRGEEVAVLARHCHRACATSTRDAGSGCDPASAVAADGCVP